MNGKNNKLHKLALGCDSDYDSAQLWINLLCSNTHIHTHTRMLTNTRTHTRSENNVSHCFRWTKVFLIWW